MRRREIVAFLETELNEIDLPLFTFWGFSEASGILRPLTEELVLLPTSLEYMRIFDVLFGRFRQIPRADRTNVESGTQEEIYRGSMV